MISKLKAAAEAAITSVPRLLMADWMTMLERLKTAPWTPAGMPTERIFFSIDQSKAASFRDRWTEREVWDRRARSMKLLRRVEHTVEAAAPSASMPMPRTKNRLEATFTMPEKKRHRKGVLVSPWLLKMAEVKLYISMPGRARNIMRR